MAIPTDRKSSLRSYTSRDDLLTAAKAIHDELKASLQGEVRESETRVLMRLGKSLDVEGDKYRAEMVKQFGTVSTRSQELVEEVREELKTLRKDFEQRLDALLKSYEEGWKGMLRLIESLPVPQVIVPEGVINLKVDNKTPDFVVNVPQQKAPVVNVAAADVTVNVPKQEAPKVDVNVPPKRLTKKTFAYDAQGKPVSVTEEEIG